MSISRRSLLSRAIKTAGAASILSGASIAGVRAVEKAPVVADIPFKEPTARTPIVASFNENPLGLSLKAQEAIANSAKICNRYPFVRVETLRKACADFIGGDVKNITLSQGSAEAIRASIEAYNKPGTQLVIPELTYSDGEMAAARNGMKITKVKMGPNWSIDIEGMKTAVANYNGPSIVYFVNPNNPTGTIVDSKPLNDWIRSQPKDTVFLVDEAYGEFVDDPKFESAAVLVKEGLANVIVLKTFSKLFAMAGLRLGFAYAHPDTCAKVHDHIAYDIFMNVPAIEAALAEMNDAEFISLSKSMNAESRKIMIDVLEELKIEYLPSQTNFIFFNLKAPLKPFADRMMAEHIMVGRPFPPADQWCRLSFTRPDDMRYIADKMREFRKAGHI